MNNLDYSELFFNDDQFLIDYHTDFKTKIKDIVSIINNYSNLNHDWTRTEILENLSENDLIHIQDIVAGPAQFEIVKILTPYVKPKIEKMFGLNQSINIRVGAQIKSSWNEEVIYENRKVEYFNNGFYESRIKPNMAYPTRVHQDLNNNGNRSSHVVIFYFQLTENLPNSSMLQIGSLNHDLCILENDKRNGYPNEITDAAQKKIIWNKPEVLPGSIALMSPLTIHRSTHKSEIPRIALNIKFQPTNLEYLNLIYDMNIVDIQKYSNTKEKLNLIRKFLQDASKKNKGLLLEKSVSSLLLSEKKEFQLDIRNLFDYDISEIDINKLAAAAILKKSTYFISDDDISILNNPLPNIIDGSCGSSIMKTFDVN